MPDKTVAVNRRAHHQFAIEETLEAGLALTGTEIKSIRAGRVNLAEAYARIERGEAWLIGAHIAPYEQGNRNNHEPTRTRKLLLHRDQIAELVGRTQAKGFTLVPMKLYIRNGMAKLEIGIGRGKKEFDKRRTIAERDARRDLERSTKERVRL
jgi:SsrA-binding protein